MSGGWSDGIDSDLVRLVEVGERDDRRGTRDRDGGRESVTVLEFEVGGDLDRLLAGDLDDSLFLL